MFDVHVSATFTFFFHKLSSLSLYSLSSDKHQFYNFFSLSLQDTCYLSFQCFLSKCLTPPNYCTLSVVGQLLVRATFDYNPLPWNFLWHEAIADSSSHKIPWWLQNSRNCSLFFCNSITYELFSAIGQNHSVDKGKLLIPKFLKSVPSFTCHPLRPAYLQSSCCCITASEKFPGNAEVGHASA